MREQACSSAAAPVSASLQTQVIGRVIVQGLGPDAKVPLDDRPTLLRASHFGPDGMLRLKGSRLARAADTPIPSLFWAAGFSFSRSALLTEVRMDLMHA